LAEKAAIWWFSGWRKVKPSMSSVCFMTAWIWPSICRIECRLLISGDDQSNPTIAITTRSPNLKATQPSGDEVV
jgi:hypothetical protein